MQTLLETLKSKIKQDVFVIENLKKQFLGVPAIKVLNLLSRVNFIKREDHKYRQEYPELFTGIVDSRI